jgi:uncharacterized protein (DUF1501 family)
MTTRRDFLKLSCGAAGLAAFEQGLERFGLMAHAAQASPADYKALVCIFMFGGNDANNMVIPRYGSGYAAYAAARGAALAIPQLSTLPITPTSLGLQFGLHPAMTGLQGLFNTGKLAVVCNTGPLNQPFATDGTAPTQYRSNAAFRPYQLFSHSDQQSTWMSPRADQKTTTGWGGLYADAVASLYNTGITFPPVASIAGNNQFNKGAVTKPLSVAPAPTPLTQIFLLNGFGVTAAETARRTAMNSLRGLDVSVPLVKATSDITQQAVDISASLAVDPSVGTFPTTGIGNQLKQVAKLIKLNYNTLNPAVSRQVFFCSIGGFDTHQDELAAHTNLYGQLSAAMTAFNTEMGAQALANNVTVFTQSDFGRTLQGSGAGASVGSDHAWGSHHLVMGGAVHGGDFYGVNGPNLTVFPDMTLGGAYDTDSRGRFIPTCAADQYASTLGLWFGVPPSSLSTIFPNLFRFTTNNIGFMG